MRGNKPIGDASEANGIQSGSLISAVLYCRMVADIRESHGTEPAWVGFMFSPCEERQGEGCRLEGGAQRDPPCLPGAFRCFSPNIADRPFLD